MIDINKLIETTSDLVNDGRINMAAKGEVEVQEIQIDGKQYLLKVSLTLKGQEINQLKATNPEFYHRLVICAEKESLFENNFFYSLDFRVDLRI